MYTAIIGFEATLAGIIFTAGFMTIQNGVRNKTTRMAFSFAVIALAFVMLETLQWYLPAGVWVLFHMAGSIPLVFGVVWTLVKK